MKKIILVVICLSFIGQGFLVPKAYAGGEMSGKISISGAFALYPLVVKWAEEFRKTHPNVKIDISAGGAGKGMTDALTGMVDIGMVSRSIFPEEIKKGALGIAVAKDAVVPVISSSNPALAQLLSKGLKQNSASAIWIDGKISNWSQLGVNTKVPIHVYTRSDACGAAEVWAKYLNKKQEDLLGSGVFGDPGLAMAVKKDPLGLGYNNIGYVFDYKTRHQLSGIRVLPLDLNNNGKIDPGENFYDNMDDLVNAIANGKYPSPPARELYLVIKGKFRNKVALGFIDWILTEGQQYVKSTGYIVLPKDVLTRERKKLQ